MLFDIALIIIIATVLSIIFKLLKQPLILAYIVTGVLLGPLVFDMIKQTDPLISLSNIGIAFLLFIVGLSLNFNVLKEVGKVSLITGIGQVVFTFIIGYLLITLLGIGIIPAIYISIALTFSSTIIIVKLLSDKNVIDTLYGRISVGFLIVQDFIAIIILILISSFGYNTGIENTIFSVIRNGIILLLFVYLFAKYVLSRLFDYIAKSQELLFISSIAWCFIVVMLSLFFGFSIEIGAFLAGISIASIPYTLNIIGKIVSLRDFFIVLFFVYLGLQITSFSEITSILPQGIILSLFVLIGNPLIVMILIGLLGYKKNIGFFTGLTVAQISEFSLILVNLGYKVGHLQTSDVALVTLVGMITITVSSYMIIYNEKIYSKIQNYLTIFERKKIHLNAKTMKKKKYDIIILGGHRLARNIVEYLRKKRKKMLVVDYDPEIIKIMNKKKIPVFYGDISNTEILKQIPFKKAKFVISTIPSKEDNIILLNYLKKTNPKIKIFLTTQHMHEVREYYDKMADYVILPYLISGENVADVLERVMRNPSYLKKLKREQLKVISDSGLLSYQLTYK